jgi:predicted nucleic acid-binding protein
VIAIEDVDPDLLPANVAISTLTLAELTAGPHLVVDNWKRAGRQELVQRVEATVDTLAFDTECARAFGGVCIATLAAGRKIRGSRAVDLMIAATASSYGMPLYTRNAADLRGLGDLIEIVDLS